MIATEQEQAIYGRAVEIVLRTKERVVYRISNESGEAIMTSEQVFPGIKLIYDEIHMEGYVMNDAAPDNLLEIKHCQEGRIECVLEDEIFHLASGDLAICNKAGAGCASCFPLHHYHGITIAIDLAQTPSCLSCFLEDVKVNPVALVERYCAQGSCFVARSKPCLEHIFAELYAVPEQIRRGYFKVKVLELLLFLTGVELDGDGTVHRRFTRTQAALAKSACSYLGCKLDRRVTIDQLATHLHVSQTVLKNSFKGVYGVSVYTYIRAQKMQAAALLLRQTDQSILEIAGRCGYDNASKFSGAFRTVIGKSPNEYRLSAPRGVLF